ncbi:SigE family RNA polymerase sigma factor [Dermatophilaceae bacterium Soc4.6]
MSRSGKIERDAEFTAFMRQAEPSLMRTAWLLTGSSDAARELVQASLVKTYASWSKVRPETALAFTRRVLVNHKVDVWRARSREVLGDTGDRPAPGGGGVSDDRDEIVRLLARLPEQQRKVVVLRYYADLSEQATADALGVSLGTVKSTASRALATLRGLAPAVPKTTPHTEPERSAR